MVKAKLTTDIGAVATAIGEFFSWLKLRMSGAETRNLKSAIRIMQKYIRRVKKEYPAASRDRTLLKYEKQFNRKIV